MRTYVTFTLVGRVAGATCWALEASRFVATTVRVGDVVDLYGDGTERKAWYASLNVPRQFWETAVFEECNDDDFESAEMLCSIFSYYRRELLGANWLITKEEPPKEQHAKDQTT